MPTSIECPSCRATIRGKDDYAGKRVRCPSCKEPVTLPTASITSSGAGDVDRVDRVPPPPPNDTQRQPMTAARTRSPLTEEDEVDPDEAGGEGYELAGQVTKKVKAVRVREGKATAEDTNAGWMRQAAAPTCKIHTPAEILVAFRGEIDPFRPSLMYSLWLMIVAGFMVLLPLIYLGLIGLVLYATVYHAVHHVMILQQAHGRGATKVALLIYVTPLLCAGAMVAFMIKPLFARPARKTKGKALDPQAEPLLFAFIDGICTSVGAPRPERIEVNCEVNAAAGYSGGPFSIFSREPVLIIGLGLVAGLNLKQLAGVMAHELGHISQGSGARLMEVITSINAWFARVVYERDEWDETIYAWKHGGNGYTILLGCIGQLAAWLVRRLLWVLLHVGHLINMVFLRQREYDADRYEARMVGAEVFSQTTRRMRVLQLATQFAMSDLRSSWQQRRLPDNFPKLIQTNVPQIPEVMFNACLKASEEARTKLFDTHPADPDRIQRAKLEEPGAGIFNLDGPATDVFRDFDALARTVTLDYYKSMLGAELSSEQLYPVAELVESQAVAQEGYDAARQFFLNSLPITQQLVLPGDYPQAPTNAKAAKQALITARSNQQAGCLDCRTATEQDSEAHVRLIKARSAAILLQSGIKLDARQWTLPAPTLEAAISARDRSLRELRTLTARIKPFATAAAERLTMALAILEVDTVADRVAEGRERRDESRTLYPCAAHLGTNVVNRLVPTIRTKEVLETLVAQYSEGKHTKNQPLVDAILRESDKLRDSLQELHRVVGDSIVYPFEHADVDMTIGRFAIPSPLPDRTEVGQLLETADIAINALLNLYRRAMGRLAVTAEEVERVLGLAPIEVAD